MAGCSSSPPKTSLASLALRNENQSARPTVRTDVWLIGAIGVVNCSVASVVPDKQRRAIKLRSRWKTGQDRQKPKEHLAAAAHHLPAAPCRFWLPSRAQSRAMWPTLISMETLFVADRGNIPEQWDLSCSTLPQGRMMCYGWGAAPPKRAYWQSSVHPLLLLAMILVPNQAGCPMGETYSNPSFCDFPSGPHGTVRVR